jgi:hypothetical protein
MRPGLSDHDVPELHTIGTGSDRCHLSGAPEATAAWS